MVGPLTLTLDPMTAGLSGRTSYRDGHGHDRPRRSSSLYSAVFKGEGLRRRFTEELAISGAVRPPSVRGEAVN